MAENNYTVEQLQIAAYQSREKIIAELTNLANINNILIEAINDIRRTKNPPSPEVKDDILEVPKEQKHARKTTKRK